MPILLWAVYIVCFLCTVIVSVSAVALAKIENAAAKHVPDNNVVPAAIVETPQDVPLENQEQGKSVQDVPDVEVQTQQPDEIADGTDVSDKSPQGRETENGRSSRANSRETQSRRERQIQI